MIGQLQGSEPGTIVIGDPDSTSIATSVNKTPWTFEFDYSFAAMIIPQTEMGDAKTITSIEFKVDNLNTTESYTSQEIIMGHITETDFSSNTPSVDLTDYSVSNKTIVKSSFTASYGSIDNDTWVKYDLTTSNFSYNGTNSLVIMWENRNGDYDFAGPNTYYDTSFGISLTAYARRDGSYPTGNCSLTNERPIMKINYA
jgi:hypothetical protein